MLWYPIIVPDWFLITGDASKRIRYVATGLPGPDAVFLVWSSKLRSNRAQPIAPTLETGRLLAREPWMGSRRAEKRYIDRPLIGLTERAAFAL